jgi:hypothetical protein
MCKNVGAGNYSLLSLQKVMKFWRRVKRQNWESWLKLCTQSFEWQYKLSRQQREEEAFQVRKI